MSFKEKKIKSLVKIQPFESKMGQFKPAKTMLDFYWKLASDNHNERLEAAAGLLKALEKEQSEDDWDYALRRLVRGLSSSRGSSRLGFSMALREVLSLRKDHITVNTYLRLVDEFFRNTGKLPGHEERGFFLGELFALQTLSTSEIIDLPSVTLQEFERFVDYVFTLATKKSWIRESCVYAMFSVINRDRWLKSDKSATVDPRDFFAMILKKIDEFSLTFTADGVALYLSIPDEFRRVAAAGVSDGWKSADPLAKGNLQNLSNALRDLPVSQQEEQKGNLKSGQNKKLHFVWNTLVLYFTTAGNLEGKTTEEETHRNKKRKSSKKSHVSSAETITSERVGLGEFWKSVVDEGYFANTASSERKYYGFEIFSLFLTTQQDSSSEKTMNLSNLFTPNFLRCLTNQSAQNDRLLHKSARFVLSTIIKHCEVNQEAVPVILYSLVGYAHNFDRLTKSKTVEKLVALIPAASLSKPAQIFIDFFERAEQSKDNSTRRKEDDSESEEAEEAEKKKADGQRIWALDNLLLLLRSHKNSISDDGSSSVAEEVVQFLIQKGFFVSSPPLSTNVVEAAKSRLNSVMSLLVTRPRNDSSSWPYLAVSYIVSQEQKGAPLIYEFEEGDELLKAKEKAVKTLEKIRRKRLASKHADTSQLEAFELLFSLVLIEVYSADSEAAGMLDELYLCYNKILGKSQIEEGGDEEDVDASQVLTEILLSFLTRKSSLMRQLTEEVWETFTKKVSLESLDLLYDVLKAKESKEGQESLFDAENDMDMDEGDEDEEDSEEDDDNDESDEDGEDEDDDSDSDVYEKDMMEEADRQANEALSKALEINRGEGSDMSDDDDESMDDEQMMALDETLSNIFKERQKALSKAKSGNQKKIEAKDAKNNMIQFKSRILDLLTIYLKNESENWLIISMILPLLTLIRTTKDRALGEKAHNIIKSKLCRGKTLPVPVDEGEGIVEASNILVRIHTEQARKSTNKAHSLACSQTSVFLAKILMNINSEAAPEMIVDAYSSSMLDWIKSSRSKFSPNLFFDIINYFSSLKKTKQ